MKEIQLVGASSGTKSECSKVLDLAARERSTPPWRPSPSTTSRRACAASRVEVEGRLVAML
jgi:hypothetical protein